MAEEDIILKSISGPLKDAVKWSNSNIAAKQEQALKYYKRSYLPGDDKLKGRSKWVSPEIAKNCDWMTASLVRIFDAPENVCEFVPFGPEDEAVATQQTKVVNWIIKTKNSHLSFLKPWLQNGLICGLGIVTVEFDIQSQESLARVLKNIPNDQLAAFMQQEEAGQIIIESASKPKLNEQGIETRDLKIRSIKRVPTFNILSVSPEDFVVSADAKFSNETGGIQAKLQGHRKVMGKQDLIDLGFDAEKVRSIPLASDKSDGIALERSKDTDGKQGISGDDVSVYQIYTKLKLDKKNRHYRLTLAGDLDAPVLLDYEETTKYYPYSAFTPYDIPDTLFGLGIPDKIGDDHLIITRMNRAVLDSLHMAVHPIKVVNPDVTNLDDLLNVSPGSVIRSTDPNGGISYNTPPFAGGQAIPVIQNLTQSLDYSTGVGPSMVSISAKDMQNVTATAANQQSNSGQLIVESISRYFADTGYRYLVKMIVDALIQKPDEAQEFVSRLTNGFVPIDEFTPDFDVTTSVAFGVMSRDQSTQTLMNLLGQQMQAMQAGLPVANAQNIYATLSKLAETAGFKNASLFFTDPSSIPPAPNPPTPVDPNAGLIEIEKVKAQLKAQDAEAQRQFDLQKFIAETDLKRDQMAQDFALQNAEITAKYNAQIDIARLKLEQSMPRDPLGNIVMQPQPMSQQQPDQMAPPPEQMPQQPNPMGIRNESH
ncbi:portal protein [Pararhizobium qamdonense]|uniref:portal protein n=1 Tax=Pararhizobium qamdonense TaxID=3031126 RepID=UPI0023E09C1C|nr:portal protein [Pararhizobium qamdonense]